MKVLSTIALLLLSLSLMACVAGKSVQQMNPGIQFMGQEELKELVSDSIYNGSNVKIKYNKDFTAEVYVKKIGKSFNGTWKVKDDGMIILSTPGQIDKGYVSLDGKKYYGTDGKIQDF